MAKQPKPPRGRNPAAAGTIRRGGPPTNVKPVRVPPGAGAGMAGPMPIGAPPAGGMGAPPPMLVRGRTRGR